ncbi:MAG TPA: hypothetical protein P5102_01840 [Candidatus Competibacteraceae bacterium]|nr:hypothetical protein [Candidatus Competibacteraceae bacterium]
MVSAKRPEFCLQSLSKAIAKQYRRNMNVLSQETALMFPTDLLDGLQTL